MGGPRSTARFLLASGILFAVLLIKLGFRTATGELAAWVIAAALVVGAAVIVLAVMFAKGVGEGRL